MTRGMAVRLDRFTQDLMAAIRKREAATEDDDENSTKLPAVFTKDESGRIILMDATMGIVQDSDTVSLKPHWPYINPPMGRDLPGLTCRLNREDLIDLISFYLTESTDDDEV